MIMIMSKDRAVWLSGQPPPPLRLGTWGALRCLGACASCGPMDRTARLTLDLSACECAHRHHLLRNDTRFVHLWQHAQLEHSLTASYCLGMAVAETPSPTNISRICLHPSMAQQAKCRYLLNQYLVLSMMRL